MVNYWLDLFSGTTWKEFLAADGKVSGFRESKKATVAKIKSGDILLCYLTGVGCWVGALEVIGPSEDASSIWSKMDLPCRLAVRALITLPPEHGVPMDQLKGKVDFFRDEAMRGKYQGFLRGSPALFRNQSDGELIFRSLKQAKAKPVYREVDPKKLARMPVFYTVNRAKGSGKIAVTVPESEEPPVPENVEPATKKPSSTVATTRHTEIQSYLLKLGADMGLQVWVARNDRSRIWKGKKLGEHSNVLSTLPIHFDEPTLRTIELIDVLWLQGKTIVAAFEVECTTSIYSGLLRMSDLLTLQPNLVIDLYLVASEERRAKVAQEINRPTFSVREPGKKPLPLPEICGFLSFEKLTTIREWLHEHKLLSYLPAAYLKEQAEYFKAP